MKYTIQYYTEEERQKLLEQFPTKTEADFPDRDTVMQQNADKRQTEEHWLFTGNFLLFEDSLPENPTLEDYRIAKIAEINQKIDTQLADGFDSDALGTTHHYRNDSNFPQWYRDQMMIQNSNMPDDVISWLTDKGMINHTAAQFEKVFKDLKDFEKPIEYLRLELLQQAQAATTQEELEAIVC